MKKILAFFAKLWSYSLLFPLTDDNNFGTNEFCKNASYRISLIGVFWGHKAYYLFTYNFANKKFSFFSKIIMERCGSLDSLCKHEDIENKANNYEKRLNDWEISEKDIDVESEFIQYSNSRQRERLELSERKINLYATVILAIVPILLVLFDIDVFWDYTILEKVLAIYVFYFLLNVIFLIFDSMKVKGYIYSRFSELKEAIDKRKRLSRNYYFDWQMNQGSAVILVSYVLNIQNFIKYAIFLAVMLTVSYNVRTSELVNDLKMNYYNSNISASVLTINTDNLDNPYSNDSIKITEIQLNVQKKLCKRIICLIPRQDYQNMISVYFDNYDNNLIIYCIDDTLEQNKIKVIEE